MNKLKNEINKNAINIQFSPENKKNAVFIRCFLGFSRAAARIFPRAQHAREKIKQKNLISQDILVTHLLFKLSVELHST